MADVGKRFDGTGCAGWQHGGGRCYYYVWEAAKHGIARLLGCGDPTQEQLAERRLEETREQLAGATGLDAEQARAALAAQWATRLADLLDVDLGAEADLRVLMQRIPRSNCPPGWCPLTIMRSPRGGT